MARILPDWCKAAKIELIRKDMSVTELAEQIGVSRVYTSQVVNGRSLAPEIAAKITNVLQLSVPYTNNII